MGRGATQVWWSWRRTIWTLWGLLAVSAATSCCTFSSEAFVAVIREGTSLKTTEVQGLVLAYTVLAILTFVELFKVRCLGVRAQPPCVQLPDIKGQPLAHAAELACHR